MTGDGFSPQSPEELTAQYGSGSAARAATDWLHFLLVDTDFPSAWAGMSPALRLARAQAWLWNNRDHPLHQGYDLDEVAARLADAEPRHELWPVFAKMELAGFQRAWPLPPGGYGSLGVASRPRPLGVDLELIFVLDLEETRRAGAGDIGDTGATLVKGTPGGVPVETFASLVMRLEGTTWLVYSHNGPERLPQPGWPPSL